MSPWAFIGFESISHSAGSFSFKTKHTLKILLISLTVSALIYIMLCQISVMAHPDAYASWYDYIANNKEAGIMGIPPFFVAYCYLGKTGVVIFGVALFAIIATSIIGNIFAVSNLIRRMAEDGIFPKSFAAVNKNDIPVRVRLFVIVTLTFIILFAILYLVKEKERKHRQQLDSISGMVNTDPLTGVNNHRAYIANEKRLLASTATDPDYRYGLVICDINDLKYVNDRFGHDYGDEYICRACRIICDVYENSPIFRIGGDEFAVIIEGEDYADRDKLLSKIKEISVNNTGTEDGILIAAGMAVKQENDSFHDVFHRADKAMYLDKNKLKELRPDHNLR